MEKTGNNENKYGLLGKNISYSFSQGYFTQKFKELKLPNHSYQNFDISDISQFPSIVKEKDLKGLNVTIPYKEDIIPFLSELDPVAKEIGAVNTIKFTKNGLKGFNTDAFGFEKSITPFLKTHHTKALILGTGGASKAIVYVLEQRGIDVSFVSRAPKVGMLTYNHLTKSEIDSHFLIINCTPLGTFPNTEEKPDIPYQFITEKHLLFDLVYNPPKTAFLSMGEKQGAQICNGLTMLQKQAEKAWEIWNRE